MVLLMGEPPLGRAAPAHQDLVFTPEQADAVARSVESAPRVARRHQFFVWTQSALHILLPHELLACGAYGRQRRELRFDLFNSIVLPTDAAAALTDTHGPLLAMLGEQWQQAGRLPLAVTTAQIQASGLESASSLLTRLGIARLLAHGVSRPSAPVEVETFFVLGQASMSSDPLSTQLALLDSMVPYLHNIWLRVLAGEREQPALATAGAAAPSAPPPAPTRARITAREREVLALVSSGKSNKAIAEVLAISPLTVKNHIQKILRKLDCSNRAQAVAEAIAMGAVPGARER